MQQMQAPGAGPLPMQSVPQPQMPQGAQPPISMPTDLATLQAMRAAMNVPEGMVTPGLAAVNRMMGLPSDATAAQAASLVAPPPQPAGEAMNPSLPAPFQTMQQGICQEWSKYGDEEP